MLAIRKEGITVQDRDTVTMDKALKKYAEDVGVAFMKRELMQAYDNLVLFENAKNKNRRKAQICCAHNHLRNLEIKAASIIQKMKDNEVQS